MSLVLSVAMGLLVPVDLAGAELVSRTKIGLDSVALALAADRHGRPRAFARSPRSNLLVVAGTTAQPAPNERATSSR